MSKNHPLTLAVGFSLHPAAAHIAVFDVSQVIASNGEPRKIVSFKVNGAVPENLPIEPLVFYGPNGTEVARFIAPGTPDMVPEVAQDGPMSELWLGDPDTDLMQRTREVFFKSLQAMLFQLINLATHAPDDSAIPLDYLHAMVLSALRHIDIGYAYLLDENGEVDSALVNVTERSVFGPNGVKQLHLDSHETKYTHAKMFDIGPALPINPETAPDLPPELRMVRVLCIEDPTWVPGENGTGTYRLNAAVIPKAGDGEGGMLMQFMSCKEMDVMVESQSCIAPAGRSILPVCAYTEMSGGVEPAPEDVFASFEAAMEYMNANAVLLHRGVHAPSTIQ